MSRIVPAEEFDLIEQVISECPEGIGISALEKALALHLPKALNRRTLQRRLERLLADKRIATEGESITLVYKRTPSVARFRLKLSDFQAWKPIRDRQHQSTLD